MKKVLYIICGLLLLVAGCEKEETPLSIPERLAGEYLLMTIEIRTADNNLYHYYPHLVEIEPVDYCDHTLVIYNLMDMEVIHSAPHQVIGKEIEVVVGDTLGKFNLEPFTFQWKRWGDKDPIPLEADGFGNFRLYNDSGSIGHILVDWWYEGEFYAEYTTSFYKQ